MMVNFRLNFMFMLIDKNGNVRLYIKDTPKENSLCILLTIFL